MAARSIAAFDLIWPANESSQKPVLLFPIVAVRAEFLQLGLGNDQGAKTIVVGGVVAWKSLRPVCRILKMDLGSIKALG